LSNLARNALAQEALAAIQQIDDEAKQKKESQLRKLRDAKNEIEARIDDLSKQMDLLDEAIAGITGRKVAHTESEDKRGRMTKEQKSALVNDVKSKLTGGLRTVKQAEFLAQFGEDRRIQAARVLKELQEEGFLSLSAIEKGNPRAGLQITLK
jgi:hypothetical protein